MSHVIFDFEREPPFNWETILNNILGYEKRLKEEELKEWRDYELFHPNLYNNEEEAIEAWEFIITLI